MSKVLYIKANPKPEGASTTFKVSDAFIESYRQQHPEEQIITLDLYKEKIAPLTADDLEIYHAPKTQESKNHPVFKYAYQFAEADKYVIAAPMWNLSFPAILGLYLDYISQPGITFMYSSHGPEGTCKGKKAIHFVSRGGEYSSVPFAELEMGDRHLRTIFAFFGITDFKTYALENMSRSATVVEVAIADAIKDVTAIANNF